MGSHDITFRADDTSAKEYTVNMAYTPQDNEHDFEGWIVNDETSQSHISDYTGEPYENGTDIFVTGDVTFSVNAPPGHWLVFNENGKGATYNAPQFVLSGHGTEDPGKAP